MEAAEERWWRAIARLLRASVRVEPMVTMTLPDGVDVRFVRTEDACHVIGWSNTTETLSPPLSPRTASPELAAERIRDVIYGRPKPAA